jgi:hypothetical protein
MGSMITVSGDGFLIGGIPVGVKAPLQPVVLHRD